MSQLQKENKKLKKQLKQAEDADKQRSKKQAYKAFLRDQIQRRVEVETKLSETELVCEQQAQFISQVLTQCNANSCSEAVTYLHHSGAFFQRQKERFGLGAMKFKHFAKELDNKIHKISEKCADTTRQHRALLKAVFGRDDEKDGVGKAAEIGRQSALMVRIKESGIFGPNLSYEAIGEIVTQFSIERVQKNIKKVKSETTLKKVEGGAAAVPQKASVEPQTLAMRLMAADSFLQD